jgi:glycosyltransferase involved in cell wall biosynthesis
LRIKKAGYEFMLMVSVIMPAYNCGKYIKESIESVLRQSYKDTELLVIDGGSVDNTDEILQRYVEKSKCVYVKKPGFGISAARNFGIRSAKGDLIAFLDADDLFVDGYIARQAAFFEKNKDCDICYTDRVYFDTIAGIETPSPYYHFRGDIFYYLKRNNFIHPSALMARRHIFENNLFDETIKSHEDWEFFLQIAAKGIRFMFIDEPLSKIRMRPGSVTTQAESFDATRREVGLRAKRYWKEFKSTMTPFSCEGRRAMMRYLKLKVKAALIGFPYRACFRKPLPMELLPK